MLPSASVAIVIPCYKQAQYLAECLDSLLGQDFQDWIAIVVDDDSPDNASEIARLYSEKDARINYYWQKNSGANAARNAGVRLTDSDYLLLLDADDVLHFTYLSKTIDAFENNPKAKVVYTRCQYFGTINSEMNIREYSFQELLRGNIFPITALFRREDYLRTPGFNETMLLGWQDWDFWLSLLGPNDQVSKIDEVLFFYRRKSESITTSLQDEDKRVILRRQIFSNHIELYNKYFEDPLNLFNRLRQLEKENRRLVRGGFFTRVARKIKGWTGIA